MRIAELKNKKGILNYNKGALSFKNQLTGDVIRFFGTEEFVVYLEEDGIINAVCSSQFDLVGSFCKNDAFSLKYMRDNVEAIVVYRSTENTFNKTVEFTAESPLKIKRITLECRKVPGSLTGGGEGIPVFVDNKMWCGIEFPAAINRREGSELIFSQAPFTTASRFVSFPVVYGLDCCGDVKKTFSDYVKSFAIPKNSLSVYCDWGAHDDLSDTMLLTEKFSYENIKEVTEFSNKSGVKFDYYLMDAYWFENNDPYIKFKKETFPNGQSGVLKMIADAGMKFGLWFDINFIHAHMKGWEKYSNMLDNPANCFAVDEVAQLMTDAVEYHIVNDGVKMLKFDFAYFECKNPSHGHSVEHVESKERSICNFIKMVERLREVEPELIILCYNGWTTSLDWIGSVYERSGYAISPYWCRYVDYLYCGDPRPSEIATGKLENSIIYYTDAMVRNFKESFLPFECIDDHGTMMGETNTIYGLSTGMFRCGVLMNVMRGSGKINPYGLLSYLEDGDAEYFNYVSKIYDKYIKEGYECSFILGDARKEEVYGYSLSGATSGYAVILNPLKHRTSVNLELEQWSGSTVSVIKRIVNGKIVNARRVKGAGAVPVELDANGYVLVEWNILNEKTTRHTVTLCAGERLRIPTGSACSVALSFRGAEDNKPIRTCYGYPEGISIRADGADVKPSVVKPIWSGVSWLYFDVNEHNSLIVEYSGERAVLLKYELVEDCSK